MTRYHVRVECKGVVDDIVETLSPEGPYAYTVSPVPTFDGSVPNQEIAYTREGIRKAYAEMHEVSSSAVCGPRPRSVPTGTRSRAE